MFPDGKKERKRGYPGVIKKESGSTFLAKKIVQKLSLIRK
jgi:hypothetical protein